MTPLRIFWLAGCLLLTSALAADTQAHPVASTSKSCKPPRYPGSGYFTSLSVRRVSCQQGDAIIGAHYACRTRSGVKGHCRTVRGYECKEHRVSIPTEYQARVTCTKGRRRVVYTYQQNT